MIIGIWRTNRKPKIFGETIDGDQATES